MNTALPRLIEPADIDTLSSEILIIDLCSDEQYRHELLDGRPPAPGKLPEKARLDALFSRLATGEDQ